MRFPFQPTTNRQKQVRLTALGKLCLGMGLLIFPVTGPVLAQDIIILKSADIAAYNKAITAFKEGPFPPDTHILEHSLQGDLPEGRKLGRKIRASNAKLVLAVGLKAALAAKLEILDIPILFCMVLNPTRYDLLRPNMDGIDLRTPLKQQLQTLRQLFPEKSRVGVLFDQNKSLNLIQRARPLARNEGLQLLSKSVSSEKGVPDGFRSLLPTIDTIWLVPDSTVITEDSLEFLLNSALEAKVPVIGFSPGLVRSGALLGLYVKYEDIGRQAADLTRSILDGTRTSKGTLFDPTHVSLALNEKVAEYLNIEIPATIKEQADDVF